MKTYTLTGTAHDDELGTDAPFTMVLEVGEPDAPIDPPPEVLPGELTVTLDFADGSSLTLNESAAVDCGDYIGEFVQQRCLVVHEGPCTVYFRPDVDGNRDEVVVEYGSHFGFDGSGGVATASGMTPAHIREPYTATIRRSDAVLATVEVPKHYWAARWRWCSAPRPIVRTLDDLVAMRALPPMSNAAMWGKTPTLPAIEYEPMGTGGLTTGMGTSGDRYELGPITEFQGGFLLTGSVNSETSMRTQAEAAGTMCIHVRDAATGAPVDVQAHPYFSQVLGGTPKIPMAERIPYAEDPGYFWTQAAHFPDVVYVPWLLTDDPYLLEECQCNAIYHATESDYHQNANKLPGMAQPSETRAWGWGMRDISRMAAFSPDSPPSWLLPRSAFQANLSNCLTFTNNYLNSTTPSCAVFGLITQGNYLSCWMMGYNAVIAGWMKWSGLFPEWDAATSYVMRFALELCAPPEHGGWDRRWPSPYQINLLNFRVGAPAGTPQPPSDPQWKPSQYDANTPTSWAECFELYTIWVNVQKHTKAFDPASWTEDRVYETHTDYPYGSNIAAPSGPIAMEVVRAVLAVATLAGEEGAEGSHAWLAEQMPTVIDSYNDLPAYRYAIWPG